MVVRGVVVHLCAWERVHRWGWQRHVGPAGAVALGGLASALGLLFLPCLPTCNGTTSRGQREVKQMLNSNMAGKCIIYGMRKI